MLESVIGAAAVGGRRLGRLIVIVASGLALVLAAGPADAAETSARDGLKPDRDLILLQRATPRGVVTTPPTAALASDPTLRVPDARACIGKSCIYANLATAFKEVIDNETITVLSGIHREAVILTANNVTVRGEPGAHIRDVAAEGKAAIVIRGENTVIEDLECSNVRVSDGNGACVRLEAPNLTLRRVHFHDNQMGILTGQNSGALIIEESVIENNGVAGGSLGHNIYTGSGILVVRNSRVLRTQNEGHGIKSRSSKTTIEDSVIGSLDGVDSRAIDIPNGGEIVIRNNVIHEGPNSANLNVIAIGLENQPDRLKYTTNSAIIENNLIISDRERNTLYFQWKTVPPPKIQNNIIVGRTRFEESGNTWYPSRSDANLAPYPFLPQRPELPSRLK